MKYKSVKHAVGHFFACLKAPQLAQGQLTPRVQEVQVESSAWLAVGSAIMSPWGLGLKPYDRQFQSLMEWATTADTDQPGPALVGELAAILYDRGMIEEKVAPIPVERHEFVDLETGEKISLTKPK